MSVSSRPGLPPPALPAPPTSAPSYSRLQAQPLLHWLAQGGRPQAAAGGRALSFAEQLSPWLGWADAIALSAVLPPAGLPPAGSPFGALNSAALAHARRCATAARQVHAGLEQAVDAHCLAMDQASRHGPGGAANLPTHHSQQRLMQQRIALARARLRQALAACSPALRQLAALDEALERALSPREQPLLAKLPGLLKQQQALAATREKTQTHTEAAEAGPRPQHSAAGAQPAGRALRAVLLAELHTRWQPVAGLLEALDESLNDALAEPLGQAGAKTRAAPPAAGA